VTRRELYFRLFGADGELRRHISDVGATLDIGCSDGRGSELLAGAAGCDIYEPGLRAAVESGRRRMPVVADLRRLPYRDGSFDAVVALDVLEHFEKDDAMVVVGEMERVARRLVAIQTPSGFVPQPPSEAEPWQEHRCGFESADLTALGYEVVGVGGPKWARGDYASFRGGPLGAGVGVVGRLALRHQPDRSFHMFAHRIRACG
jgi:SAM-dependent methyltransferase